MDNHERAIQPVKAEIDKPQSAMDELLNLRGDIDPDKLVAIAEKRVKFLRQLGMISLQRTSIQDWSDQDGSPYLESTGAEKLMPLWGVYIKDTKETELMDLATGRVSYFLTARCGSHVLNIETDCMGGRSADDDFFVGTMCACGHKRREHTGGQCSRCECSQYRLQPKPFDKLDVKKAAFSNLVVNAVTRILGLRGLTWEDVEEFTKGKISREKATGQVRYQKGSSTASVEQGEGSKARSSLGNGHSTQVISDPQRKRLWAIAKQAGWKDEEIKDYLLREHNIEHTKDIPRSDYDAICEAFQSGGSH